MPLKLAVPAPFLRCCPCRCLGHIRYVCSADRKGWENAYESMIVMWLGGVETSILVVLLSIQGKLLQ